MQTRSQTRKLLEKETLKKDISNNTVENKNSKKEIVDDTDLPKQLSIKETNEYFTNIYYESRLKNLKKKLRRFKKKYQNSQNDFRELDEVLQDLEADYDDLREDFDDLNCNYDQLTDDYNDLRCHCFRLEDYINEITEDDNITETASNEDILYLEGLLKEKDAKIQDMDETIRDLNASKTELFLRNLELTRENRMMRI